MANNNTTSGFVGTTGFATTNSSFGTTTGDDPFGRVASTHSCFAANEVSGRSGTAQETVFAAAGQPQASGFGYPPASAAVNGNATREPFADVPRPNPFDISFRSNDAPAFRTFGFDNQATNNVAPPVQPFGQTRSGGLFGPAFMSTSQVGTSNPPYQWTRALDPNGSEWANYMSITQMAPYSHKSVEELRYEDYLKQTNPAAAQTAAAQHAPPAVASRFGLTTSSSAVPPQPGATLRFGSVESMFGTPIYKFGVPATLSSNGFKFGSHAAPAASSNAFGKFGGIGSQSTPTTNSNGLFSGQSDTNAFGSPASIQPWKSEFGTQLFGPAPAAVTTAGFGSSGLGTFGFGVASAPPPDSSCFNFGACTFELPASMYGFYIVPLVAAIPATGTCYNCGAAQPPPPTSLFGSSPNSNGTFASTTTAFGTSTQPPGTSAFGSTGGFGSTTSAFGAPSTSTSGGFGSAFGSTPATSSSSGFGGFGSQPATGTTGGGLFGGAARTGGFGTSAPTSGFGAPSTSAFAAAPATGTTGGFGSTGFGTSGFGATSQPQQGSFGFGSTGTTTGAFGGSAFGKSATSSGFGFGSTTTPATGGTSSFSFGGTSHPSTSTSLFGGTSAAPSTSAFSFGSTSAKPAGTGFGFGSTTGTGGFGSSTGSAFGSTTGTSAFGTAASQPLGGTTSLFGSTPATGSAGGFGFGSTTAPAGSSTSLFGTPNTGGNLSESPSTPSTCDLFGGSSGWYTVGTTTGTPGFGVKAIDDVTATGSSTSGTTALTGETGKRPSTNSESEISSAIPSQITDNDAQPKPAPTVREETPKSDCSLATDTAASSPARNPVEATPSTVTVTGCQFETSDPTPNHNTENKTSSDESAFNMSASMVSSLPVARQMAPVLRNADYYTVPAYERLREMTEIELKSVKDFAIGCVDIGMIQFPSVTDLRGVDLDAIVVFNDQEIVVYPEKSGVRPSVGKELNKPAIMHVWGMTCTLKEFVQKLKTQAAGVQVVASSALHGVWTIQVEHF